ncbi:MAG: LytR/AlgR family response regulator transcription factor, partial [Verrucomicrobiales bacterium]
LDRVRSMLAKPDLDTWQEKLAEMLASRPAKEPQYLQRIEIKSQGQTDYVRVADIYWLEADGNYMDLHTIGKTHLARITMAELERQLDPNQFLRVSRSALVNLRHVRSIQSVGRRGHVALLDDDQKVTLTRALDELQERLKFSRTAG